MQSIAKLNSLKEIYIKELENMQYGFLSVIPPWDTENENEFYTKQDIINTLNKIENKLKYL